MYQHIKPLLKNFFNSRNTITRARLAPVVHVNALSHTLHTMHYTDPPETLVLIRQHAITESPEHTLEDKIVSQIDEDAQFVLIGEASHGTEDFYQSRAAITQQLIKTRGFNAVVVEADFPDAFRVNLYVRGLSDDENAREALDDFTRFPLWMWRNVAVKDFVEALKVHNATVDEGLKCGVYGMDLYSLHSSAAKVIKYLSIVDPKAAERAKSRYHCFDRYSGDCAAYGLAVGLGGAPSCQQAAIATLKEMLASSARYAEEFDGIKGSEMAFQAKANAAVVQGAEVYYRNMFFSEESTWNLRDTHFADTVGITVEHLKQRLGKEPKLVLWAHNSHLGDASKTEMGQRRGELNLGQLMRERYGNKVVNIGFTTHVGTVAAAQNWGEPCRKMRVKSSKLGTWEHLLHRSEVGRFALDFRHGSDELRKAMHGPLLERAIGVIYRPQTERQSHLFSANISEQFDYVIHFDSTHAVHPLDVHPTWHVEEDLPETFPFAV